MAALLVGAAISGCKGGGGSDAVSPENTQALTDTTSLAKKVNGDYDKLSDAEKQQVLKTFGNNEQQARTMLMNMAHPPNERMRNGGGPPGPPPGFGRSGG